MPVTILAGRVPNNARPDYQLQAFKLKTVVSGHKMEFYEMVCLPIVYHT